MTDLKPCPFCGGEAERQSNNPTKEQLAAGLAWGLDFNDGGSFIHCKQCDASTALHFDRCENLVDSWNRRKVDWADKIAAEARRYAEFYPQSSDGRNTFVMFAEWVESLNP